MSDEKTTPSGDKRTDGPRPLPLSRFDLLVEELEVSGDQVHRWQQDWRTSKARTRSFGRHLRLYSIGAAALGMILGLLVYVWNRLDSEQYCRNRDWNSSFSACMTDRRAEIIQSGIVAAGISLVIALAMAVLLAMFSTRADGYAFVRESAIAERKRRLGEIEGQLFSAELELPTLWRAVNQRLDLYHSIATNQADTSFRRAQFAMLTTFVLLALCAGLAVLVKDTAAAFSIGAVGALSAALGVMPRHVGRDRAMTRSDL